MRSAKFVVIGLMAGLAATLPMHGRAQAPPPAPPPVQGTIALEGNMKKFYRAANVIVVATIDGVEHMYHFTKDLVVHGGKGSGVDALEGMTEGSMVVVHYLPQNGGASAVEIDTVGNELKISEGVLSKVDHGRKEITIKFVTGRTETLRLTERAAAESSGEIDQAAAKGAQVRVYYSDEGGRKVAHFVKKAP